MTARPVKREAELSVAKAAVPLAKRRRGAKSEKTGKQGRSGKAGKSAKSAKAGKSGKPGKSSNASSVAELGASVLLAEELYRLVGRSRRLLWMSAARRLEARGRSIFTWQVLCYLVRNGPTTQRDLAYANAQHPAGISRLLEELESEKLIRRAADPNDRRKLLVEPTAKGRAWLDAETPDVMSAVDIAMRELSTPQREDLRALLERLLASTEVPKVTADRA